MEGEKDADTRSFERELSAVLGLKVEIKRGSGESGNLVIGANRLYGSAIYNGSAYLTDTLFLAEAGCVNCVNGITANASGSALNRAISVHDFGGTQTVSAGTFTVVLPGAD